MTTESIPPSLLGLCLKDKKAGDDIDHIFKYVYMLESCILSRYYDLSCDILSTHLHGWSCLLFIHINICIFQSYIANFSGLWHLLKILDISNDRYWLILYNNIAHYVHIIIKNRSKANKEEKKNRQFLYFLNEFCKKFKINFLKQC